MSSFLDDHTEIRRCNYSGGKCQRERAIKTNGELHSLCEFHRQRAIKNQRRLDQKRRNERLKRQRMDRQNLSSPNVGIDSHFPFVNLVNSMNWNFTSSGDVPVLPDVGLDHCLLDYTAINKNYDLPVETNCFSNDFLSKVESPKEVSRLLDFDAFSPAVDSESLEGQDLFQYLLNC